MAKKAMQPVADKEIPEICQKLVIYPNPSNGNMIVKYDLLDEEGTAEVSFSSLDGKLISRHLLNETKGEVQLKCNECTTGQYIISLYIDGNVQCSKNVQIKK